MPDQPTPAIADPLAARIIEASLELAEERGWEAVRLHDVADRLGIGLEEISARFPDLDAVANAWFTRVRDDMLRAGGPALADRPPPERLHAVMMAWFDILAPRREVVGEILRAKLHLPHPHHWIPLVFDLSRLMHWFLDAATIRSTGRQRGLAEIGLTAIFLATLRQWVGDDSPDQMRTRAALRRRLERADRWLARAKPLTRSR